MLHLMVILSALMPSNCLESIGLLIVCPHRRVLQKVVWLSWNFRMAIALLEELTCHRATVAAALSAVSFHSRTCQHLWYDSTI